MRSLTFAAAMLIVGMAAVSVDASKIPNHLGHKEHARQATRSIERLVKLHRAGYFLMDKKARSKFDLNKLDSHKFNPQQDLSGLQNASPGCQSAYASFFVNHGACFTSSSSPLNAMFGTSTPQTNAEAAATWEAFRTSSCYSAFTSDYRSFVEACRADFGNKAANEALVLPTLIEHFAAGTGTDGTKCGVTFNAAKNFGMCEIANSTLCSGAALSETCQVVDKKEYDLVEEDTYSFQYNAGGTSAPRNVTCESKWSSSSALSSMCNGCFGTFVRRYRNLAKDNDMLDSFAVYERLLCSKNTVGGGYCLNDMAEYGTSNILTETQIDGICADRGVLGCYLGMLSTSIATAKKSAVRSFKSCITGYSSYSTGSSTTTTVTVDQLSENGNRGYCLRYYKNAIEEIKEAKIMSRYLCMQNSAGNNCIVGRQGLFTNTQGCYRAAQQQLKYEAASSWRRNYYGLYNCSNCSTVLQNYVDNLGCCAGLVQEATSEVLHFGPLDYPTVAGIPTAAQMNITAFGSQNCTVPSTIPSGSEATTMSGPGAIQNTARCGVTGLDSALCTKCAKSQKVVKKELKLKISWAKLQDDEALKEKVKLGLRTDMADNLGISIEDIVNDEIAEDTSVSVTITSTTTTTRRQTTETQSSGTVYNFEITGQTDDQVDAAGENFDSMESSGTLEIESTEAATSDCNCVGDGQLAVADEETSGAAAATAIVGAFVALLCLLF